MTFVAFACFATTRFRAKNTWDSAQGFIQCMKCIGNPVVRTDGRTYVWTDVHVTIMRASHFYECRFSAIWLACLPFIISSELLRNNQTAMQFQNCYM